MKMPCNRVILPAVLFAVATSVSAQSANKLPTPTRGVMVFSDLETRLAGAVARHDHRGIDALLAADFEQRRSAIPEVPEPRAEWLASEPYSSRSPELERMAVHDYGTLAVFSFTMTQPSTRTAPLARRDFLVDIWRKNGNDWQLQVRYRTPLQVTKASPARPTGKE